MNEQDHSKKRDRFRIFHWDGKDFVDEDGHSSKDYSTEPTGTPQEIAEQRNYQRWLSLSKATNHFGWFGVALIWLAIVVSDAVHGYYGRLNRVLKRNDFEDPAFRDVIALGLIEIGPVLPGWFNQRIEAWDQWRLDYGMPLELRRPVKLEQPPRASGKRSSSTPPAGQEGRIYPL